MNDEAEQSNPSNGSVSEPAAWGVLRVGGAWVSILANEVQAETSRKSFDKMENWTHEVVPLYRSPAITDEERELLMKIGPSPDPSASYWVAFSPDQRKVAYGLLERLK